MASQALLARIEGTIQPVIEAMGFDLVRVQLSGQHRQRLQVMIERPGGAAILVDDCAEISRAVSAVLDVADPIVGPYTLEVSSPGIDRPLVRLADFDRFRGLEARLETDRPIDGRRRFKGRILGTDGSAVRLQFEGGEVSVPHIDIVRAKLVLTDELLAASLGRTKETTG